jgi:hypothetical protein
MSPTITEIDPVTLHRTFEAMERHGGSFCAALARAWFKADPANKRRIESAFTHLLADFGPASRYYSTHA